MADDCMGLAQQVAYSSLLAFFPAMVFLIGVLGLIGAYDALLSFLDPGGPELGHGPDRAAPAGLVAWRLGGGRSPRGLRSSLGREAAPWARS